MSRLLYFFLCILLYTSCDFLNENKEAAGINLFSDEVIQTIYQHQDQRQTDSLLPYFRNENVQYRVLAAEAFASVQDSNACTALLPLLEEQDSLVVRAAAYALGQTACPQALHPLMAQASNASVDQETRFYILEAIGKCANDTALAFLSNYPIQNCPEGVAAGLLRASIKSVTSAKSLSIATKLLEDDFSEKTRVFASTYLARLRDQDLSPIADSLTHGLRHDVSPFVRMNCAIALGYTQSMKGVEALQDAVIHDESVLVQVNALKGLQRKKNEIGFEVAFEALKHLNGQVAFVAAQLVSNQLSEKNEERVLAVLGEIKNWRVKATLMEGLIGMNPEKYSDKALVQLRKSSSAYEQASLIDALASHPENYGFIKERLYTAEDHVVRTAAIDALIKIRNHERFEELEKLQPKITQEFAGVFKKAIESKDIGQVYSVAIELRDPEKNYRQWFDNIDFLSVTRDAMELPKDIEGYQELQKTIDFFENNTTETTIEKSADHPIDWALVKTIPQKQLMQISTSKGDITMELYVNEAPGTVATIVSLVNSGFYNGKKFHRVVPNFVAQGGCPRGDGFGGLAYTIRSEFAPLYYEQGSVGVASAGKDTESCQWFITHSPTPHLDGRYTIFAKVTKGIEVVQQLQVGDLIEHVSLVN